MQNTHTHTHTLMMMRVHAPTLFDSLPADAIAAVFELVDARDLLHVSVAMRRRLTDLLPNGWALQAQRPITNAEHTGLLGVGVPVRLWTVCPFYPDGLRLIWRSVYKYSGRTIDVYEDHRGVLFLDQHLGVPNTPNHWTVVSERQFIFTNYRMMFGYKITTTYDHRPRVVLNRPRRFTHWRNEQVETSPPLMLTDA